MKIEQKKLWYKDKIQQIKAIEENDIEPLVKLGKAHLVKISESEEVPFWLEHNTLNIKLYEILLKTNLSFVFAHARVKFVYDERTGFGEVQISKVSAWLLEQAYENEDKENGHRVIVVPDSVSFKRVTI